MCFLDWTNWTFWLRLPCLGAPLPGDEKAPRRQRALAQKEALYVSLMTVAPSGHRRGGIAKSAFDTANISPSVLM